MSTPTELPPPVSREIVVEELHRLVGARRATAVVITGSRWLGRSTVLARLGERLVTAGWTVDAPALQRRTGPTAGARPSRRAILVDDLHLADDAVLATVRDRVDDGWVLLASASTAALARRRLDLPHDLVEVALAPLDAADEAELAVDVVRRHADAAVADATREEPSFTRRTLTSLRRVSGGRPGAVVELVDAAASSGALSSRHGRWHLEGDWPISHRLSAHARAAVGHLSAAGSELVALVCLHGCLPVDQVRALGLEVALQEARRAGLVDDAGDCCIPADPPIAHVLRSELSSVRRRALARRCGTTDVVATVVRPACADPVEDDDLLAAGWHAVALGREASARGAAQTARDWFVEAQVLADVAPPSIDRDDLAEVAAAGRSLVDRWLGLPLEPLPTVDAAEQDARVTGSHAVLRATASAWRHTDDGDDAAALAILTGALRRAAGAGDGASTTADVAVLLWEIARLGGVRAVESVRAELDDAIDAIDAIDADAAGGATITGALLTGLAAMGARDLPALRRVEDHLAGHGALLHAAEVASVAAVLERQLGSTRAAARSVARASDLLASCEGARTRLVVDTVEVTALSPRERAIVRLVQEGMSSAGIADRLQVSVRTVSNHLQSVYGKLGISSRQDLVDLSPARRTGS